MNILNKLQEMCDDALVVAEKSKKPQQEVICALVTVVGKLIDLNTKKSMGELELKAANYAALLRQGHSVNKANLAKTLDDLIVRNALDEVAY